MLVSTHLHRFFSGYFLGNLIGIIAYAYGWVDDPKQREYMFEVSYLVMALCVLPIYLYLLMKFRRATANYHPSVVVAVALPEADMGVDTERNANAREKMSRM